MSVLLIAMAAAWSLWPQHVPSSVIGFFYCVFLFAGFWRLFLLFVSCKPEPRPIPEPQPDDWPRYAVLAALHDEADVIAQLTRRLGRMDYPADRLTGLLVLEADDQKTIEAARDLSLPDWLSVHIVPPGSPRTKARALNHALGRVQADFVTIYDAEDDPDPDQLKEAASRLMADPSLACVQAPLRIRFRDQSRGGFLERQFAIEYAALFEALVPAMARLDLPFPLGGTSNHFRVTALRSAGGWDAWNVTEDADLGFRLWRRGWRLGTIGRPTYEAPPEKLAHWLPQRTRWLKGYMQTWLVHTRSWQGMGWRGAFMLQATLGLGLVSAALHALALVWLVASALTSAPSGLPPMAPPMAICVMALGVATAWSISLVGADRAGVTFGYRDMLVSPFYWALQSLAFVHAVWRLLFNPHAWDKTPHAPDAQVDESAFDLDDGQRGVFVSTEGFAGQGAAPSGRRAA